MEKKFKYIFSLFFQVLLFLTLSDEESDCPPPPVIVNEIYNDIDYSAVDSTILVQSDTDCKDKEIRPELDLEKLRQNVKYPKYLKCKAIEGRVIVKALIDKFGICKKAEIDSTTNEYFNKSALQAVASTKFVPARQCKEGKFINIMVWVDIPIRYRLR